MASSLLSSVVARIAIILALVGMFIALDAEYSDLDKQLTALRSASTSGEEHAEKLLQFQAKRLADFERFEATTQQPCLTGFGICRLFGGCGDGVPGIMAEFIERHPLVTVIGFLVSITTLAFATRSDPTVALA